jgi:hypothetical protein
MLRPEEMYHLIIQSDPLGKTHFIGELTSLAKVTKDHVLNVCLLINNGPVDLSQLNFKLTKFSGEKMAPKQEVVVPPLTPDELIEINSINPAESPLPWFLTMVGLATRQEVGLAQNP